MHNPTDQKVGVRIPPGALPRSVAPQPVQRFRMILVQDRIPTTIPTTLVRAGRDRRRASWVGPRTYLEGFRGVSGVMEVAGNAFANWRNSVTCTYSFGRCRGCAIEFRESRPLISALDRRTRRAASARAPGWPGRSGAPIPDRDTGSNPSDRPSGRDASL